MRNGIVRELFAQGDWLLRGGWGDEREGCVGGVHCTYVDEEPGVLQSGLLADLLHDFGLCVEGHFELLLYGVWFCVVKALFFGW